MFNFINKYKNVSRYNIYKMNNYKKKIYVLLIKIPKLFSLIE